MPSKEPREQHSRNEEQPAWRPWGGRIGWCVPGAEKAHGWCVMESGTGTGHLDLADHGEEYRFRSLSALGGHRRVEAKKFHELEVTWTFWGSFWLLLRKWIRETWKKLDHWSQKWFKTLACMCVCACACVCVVCECACMSGCEPRTSIHLVAFCKLNFLRPFFLLRKIIPIRRSCTSYWLVWKSWEEAAQGSWKHYRMFGRLSKCAHWKAEVNFWAFGMHLPWYLKRDLHVKVERYRSLSSWWAHRKHVLPTSLSFQVPHFPSLEFFF